MGTTRPDAVEVDVAGAAAAGAAAGCLVRLVCCAALPSSVAAKLGRTMLAASTMVALRKEWYEWAYEFMKYLYFGQK